VLLEIVLPAISRISLDQIPPPPPPLEVPNDELPVIVLLEIVVVVS